MKRAASAARCDAPLYAAQVAGDTQLAVSPLYSGVAQVKGGLLRGLAVTGPRRAIARTRARLNT
jgi:hypothetical protein